MEGEVLPGMTEHMHNSPVGCACFVCCVREVLLSANRSKREGACVPRRGIRVLVVTGT